MIPLSHASPSTIHFSTFHLLNILSCFLFFLCKKNEGGLEIKLGKICHNSHKFYFYSENSEFTCKYKILSFFLFKKGRKKLIEIYRKFEKVTIFLKLNERFLEISYFISFFLLENECFYSKYSILSLFNKIVKFSRKKKNSKSDFSFAFSG